MHCETVCAQQSLGKLLEPSRFALVIGNANYGEYGDLPTLGSPCSDDKSVDTDVKVVSEALALVGWRVETECDLTTERLRTKISEFNDRVNREERAFGIIYFSGHGAQVSGTNYLFGVDAKIKEKLEFGTFKQNPYAILFGGSAVPLDPAMRQSQPLWGKAVAVFVDACRTNPILAKMRAEGLDIIRYPSPSSNPPNVLFAFSTKDGEPSPDGGLGGVSRYAKALAAAIRSQTADKQEELDAVLATVSTQVFVQSKRTQLTDRAGSIQRPPKFCIIGCPSLEEDWKTFTEQFGPGSQRQRASSHGRSEHLIATRVLATDEPVGAPRFLRMSLGRQIVAQASTAPQTFSPPVRQAPDKDINTSVSSVRSIRFDLLYCMGDSSEDLRKKKADRIRAYLSQLTGSNSPVGGFEVDEINVVGIPPAVNASIYKATDSVLTFNQDSPAQGLWATTLHRSLGDEFRVEPKPGAAPDYMAMLICDGARPLPAGPTIYLQAANRDQLVKASALSEGLTQRLPNAKVAKGVEVVEKSPNQTEIRYFSPTEAADADAVARTTQELLNQPVRTRFVPGYDNQLKGVRLVEVWMGKKE